MSKGIKPENGYAFKHKETGNPSFMLFLGTGDSRDNYEEISEAEYRQIMAEAEAKDNHEMQ